MGGKAIFNNMILDTVAWKDERLLIDIDTIEDYEKLNTNPA